MDEDVVQKQQRLDEAHDVLVGEHPKIEAPFDGEVSLAFGLFAPDGTQHTDARVRELVGVDEEVLLRIKDPIERLNEAITRSVERIGPINLADKDTDERRHLLGELLIGDREALLLGVSVATWGPTRDIPWTCQSCGSEHETTLVLLEDFPQNTNPEEPVRPAYEYVLRDGVTTISYRLANGHDQMWASSLRGSSLGEMNTEMLVRCIMQVDGQVPLDARQLVRSMGVQDRQNLLSGLSKYQPTVATDITLPCPSCGFNNIFTVDWGSIFRLI